MYIRYNTKAVHVERYGIHVPDSLKNASDKEIKDYLEENDEEAEFLDFVDVYDRNIEKIVSREV